MEDKLIYNTIIQHNYIIVTLLCDIADTYTGYKYACNKKAFYVYNR